MLDRALVTALILGAFGCGSAKGVVNGGAPNDQDASRSTSEPPADSAPSGSGSSGGSSSGGSASSSGGASSDAGSSSGGEDASSDAGDTSETGSDDSSVSGPGPTGFVHPGVHENRGMLDFVKAKIAGGADPWKSALAATIASPFASMSYKPAPLAHVICGSYSNPDIGCTAEKNDSAAAYTHALLWYYTGNQANAQKAIEIMNAWSAVVQTHANNNAPIESGWTSSLWTRAAEIIRYSNAGWSAADATQFGVMLKNAYVPYVINGEPKDNGNHELSDLEGLMGMAVYLEDMVMFQKAVAMWRGEAPAYFYLKSDGPKPLLPPGGYNNWHGQTQFTADGICQEECRDLGHTQYGIAATANAAETALIQGVNLYSEQATRLAAGLEFTAQFLVGTPVPGWLCGGRLTAVTPDATWEVAYNEYANRLGMPLPSTKALIAKIRPTGADHHMIWESLTHAEIGNAGIR